MEQLLTWIKARMSAGGVSQKDLVPVLGISQPQISDLLNGKTRLMLESYLKLSDAVKFDPHEGIRVARGE